MYYIIAIIIECSEKQPPPSFLGAAKVDGDTAFPFLSHERLRLL
jgi:hypothetical protein